MPMPPSLPSSLPRLPQIPFRGENACFANGCSACCHDTEMILTEDDVARIAAARPGEDFWFLADDGYLQLRSRDGPAARGGEGKPCIFLSPDGACTIHDVRPEGCRLYPAVWADDLRDAELDDIYCPHTSGFLLPVATKDAARRLSVRLHDERERRTSKIK